MKMSKNTIKPSLLSFALLSVILVGVLTTSVGASVNYQLSLVKGTDEFTVELYDDFNWNFAVGTSLTPSDWFEGDAIFLMQRVK